MSLSTRNNENASNYVPCPPIDSMTHAYFTPYAYHFKKSKKATGGRSIDGTNSDAF
jgi:hypothetical protein